MPVSKQLLGVKGDECICGRRATIRHCPACGSTRCYARLNRFHQFVGGEIRKVDNEFRCQGCGHLYVDEERALCEAPPVGPVLAAQRVKSIYDAKQAGEHLNPKEVKIAKAIDSLVGGQTEEQRAAADKRLDFQIRQLWADEVFAHKEGRQENHPGPIEPYIERRKREFLEQK